MSPPRGRQRHHLIAHPGVIVGCLQLKNVDAIQRVQTVRCDGVGMTFGDGQVDVEFVGRVIDSPHRFDGGGEGGRMVGRHHDDGVAGRSSSAIRVVAAFRIGEPPAVGEAAEREVAAIEGGGDHVDGRDSDQSIDKGR